MIVPLRSGLPLLALVLGVGCTAEVTPEPAPPPPYVAVRPAPPPPPPAAPFQPEVVYEQPPVVDIETYPNVYYAGAPAYYVGGVWYRRDARGWARYRVEPPQLAREREIHGREARWTRAQRAPRPRR